MARPKGVKDSKPRIPRKCYKTFEMIGKKYNRLLVLEITEKGRSPRIKVKCDCGTIKEISPYDITKRKVLSCGCFHKEEMSKRQIKPNNEAAKRKLFNNYRAGALIRNIEFKLKSDEVYNIANNNCYYCDIPPNNLLKTVGGKILINGIDRVDNSVGYLTNNCVPCCKKCNLAKHDSTKEIILRAYRFLYE